MTTTPTTDRDFAACLARLRKAAGLNQRDLARALGVSQQFVSRMESGRSKPSLQTLHDLADALGVSLDELCGRAARR